MFLCSRPLIIACVAAPISSAFCVFEERKWLNKVEEMGGFKGGSWQCGIVGGVE